VRNVTLDAFEHREMPYEKLVEELQPQRNLSFDPVCQVYFALQNMPTAALELGGITLSIEPVYTGTAKSDLTVWAAETATGALEVTAEYALDLFAGATIRRLLGHFVSVLEGMTANPRASLSQLPLLTADERRLMLTDWNATATDYPRESVLPELFAAQAARTPHATALVFNDEELTFAELEGRVRRRAAQLRAHGVAPDVLVGVCLERSLEMMISLLAIHHAGGAYVPLDPLYPKERIAFMLQDSGAPVLLTQLSLLPNLPPHQAAVICVDAPPAPNGAPPEPAAPFGGVRPEHLAYVLYTSGSTGNPKGVMVTHRNVVNFFAGMDRALEQPAGAPPGVWLAVTSISFDISVLELFWTLTRGFKVVLLADEARRPGFAGAAPAVAAPKRVLDLSLFYFASEAGGSGEDAYRLLLEGARFADRHGFKAVWTPERHFHAFGGLYPNPSVVSAAIAAITERVQIRAGSVVSPLHHPARIAEEWSVVDNLSHGRVGLSFANGWHDRDFALNPAAFADRRDIMRRNLDTVRTLWRGEAVEFTGGRGNAVPVKIFPRPVQRELPVWVTAAGNPDTFKLAGEMGAGVLTHLLGQELDDLAEKIKIYRAARKAHGHDAGCVTIALHTFVGEDLAAVKEKVRGPLCRYLADSADLLRGLSQALYPGADMAKLPPEEMNALVEYSFNRYFDLCGLLGTPATCRTILAKLAALGVDEVACLIDFGVEPDAALESLKLLDGVRAEFQAAAQGAGTTPTAAPAITRSLIEQMQRHQVTHLQCTPSMARLLAGSPETLEALKVLRKLMVGGEALPVGLAAQLARELPGTVLNMYGPTETTIWSTTSLVTGEPNPTGAVDIGRPIANTQVYVLDAHRQPVPIGVPGELWIGGDGVARGYWHRPDLTADKFVDDPFLAGNRMYRTGDLVRFRADGVIDFLGRVDHQVKLRGHRIELGEIESALMQHSSVRQAIVVLRGDQADDPQLVAYLVAGAEEPAAETLRPFLRQKLPEHMIPPLFVTLPQLPLTPNGKVDRKQLPAPTGGGRAKSDRFIAPQAGTEQAIAAIWKDILKTEPIGVDDNFFDFGGHSLQVVQVQNRLRESLGIDVPVLKLFQFPTIRTLARHLAEQSSGQPDSFRDRIERRNQLRQSAALRRPPATLPRS
jgi:natural product biosynthesis luciferase-like monooxygenase protein